MNAKDMIRHCHCGWHMRRGWYHAYFVKVAGKSEEASFHFHYKYEAISHAVELNKKNKG